jgi:hypothetical protein
LNTVTEQEFRDALYRLLDDYRNVKSVSGPGRSGAVASVYASHYLGVPWFPAGKPPPDHLRPHLVVDTAIKSGATLRRLSRQMDTALTLAVFEEPPRLRFWYERPSRSLVRKLEAAK